MSFPLMYVSFVYYLEQTYTKNFLIVYLKFTFHLGITILSGNSNLSGLYPNIHSVNT